MPESISRSELKDLLTEVLAENQEPEISLADIVNSVRRHGRFALVCGAVLAAIVAGYFFVIVKPEYRASAQFLIPQKPASGILNQEAYVTVLKSREFTDVVRQKMGEDLKSEIESEFGAPLEKLVSFEQEGSLLSASTKRNSDLVGVTARSRSSETSANLANLVANEFMDFAAKRRNEKIDEDIEGNEAFLELESRLFEEARTSLQEYIRTNTVLIPGRTISTNGKALLFDEEGESSPKQAMETDVEYYEFSNTFQRKFGAVVKYRDNIERLKLEKDRPFRDVEFVRPAEPPLEPANSDFKKTVLFVAFAFFFGFGGWIVFRSALSWLKTVTV